MEHMRAAHAVVQDVVQVAHNGCFQSGTRSVLVGVLGGTHNEVRVELARNKHKEGDTVQLVLQLRHHRGDDLRDPNSDGLDVCNTRTDTAQVRVTAVQGHLVSNVGVHFFPWCRGQYRSSWCRILRCRWGDGKQRNQDKQGQNGTKIYGIKFSQKCLTSYGKPRHKKTRPMGLGNPRG